MYMGKHAVYDKKRLLFITSRKQSLANLKFQSFFLISYTVRDNYFFFSFFL